MATITQTTIDVSAEIHQIAMLHAKYINSVSNGNVGDDIMEIPSIVDIRIRGLKARLAQSTYDYQSYPVDWLVTMELYKIFRNAGLKTIIVLDGDDETCGICLDEMTEGCETKAMDCMHRFHPNCLDKWLDRSKSTCPLCRHTQRLY